jgi:hypothetical protein
MDRARFQRKKLFADDPLNERLDRIKRFEDKKLLREQKLAKLRILAKAIESRDESLKELLASTDLSGDSAINLLVESGVADSIQSRFAQDLEAFMSFSRSVDSPGESASPPHYSAYLQLVQLVVFLNSSLNLAEAVEMRLLSSDFLCSFRLLLDTFVCFGSLDHKCYVPTAQQVFLLLSKLKHAELLEVLWQTELFNFMFNQLFDHSLLSDQNASHLLEFSLEFVQRKAHRGHDSDVATNY